MLSKPNFYASRVHIDLKLRIIVTRDLMLSNYVTWSLCAIHTFDLMLLTSRYWLNNKLNIQHTSTNTSHPILVAAATTAFLSLRS